MNSVKGSLRKPVTWALVVIAIGTVGGAGFGYSTLSVSLSGTPSVSPKFRPVLEAIGGVTVNLLVERDLVGAAAAVIDGIQIEGAVAIENGGPLSVYIPALTHRIRLNGDSLGRIVETPSFWLGSGAERVVDVGLFIETEEIPAAALGVVATGGRLDVAIDSQLRLGLLKFQRATDFSADLPGVLRDAIR